MQVILTKIFFTVTFSFFSHKSIKIFKLKRNQNFYNSVIAMTQHLFQKFVLSMNMVSCFASLTEHINGNIIFWKKIAFFKRCVSIIL